MLVEVDLSAIVADMEDGEEGDVGHHVGGGMGSDFMNMVRLLLSFLMACFLPGRWNEKWSLVHFSRPSLFFRGRLNAEWCCPSGVGCVRLPANCVVCCLALPVTQRNR